MCDERLENLNKVMTLYSRGTFGKDSFQWTKCVVKYLYDVYSDLSNQMVAFLVEVRTEVRFVKTVKSANVCTINLLSTVNIL